MAPPSAHRRVPPASVIRVVGEGKLNPFRVRRAHRSGSAAGWRATGRMQSIIARRLAALGQLPTSTAGGQLVDCRNLRTFGTQPWKDVHVTEPDMEWVVATLERFIEITKPHNLSGGNLITPRMGAAVPNSQVIDEQDTVEAILFRFYPRWREENNSDPNYRWAQHRVSAQRCLAKIRRRQELEEKLGFTGPRLSSGALHEWVWDAARPQWESGHLAEAVVAAARNINSRLQQKVGRRDVSEKGLVEQAFSLRPPESNAARLRVMQDDGSDTYRTIQSGVLSFGVGCFMAIRSPLTHLAPAEIDLDERGALERLAAFSLFATWIDDAEVVVAGRANGEGAQGILA